MINRIVKIRFTEHFSPKFEQIFIDTKPYILKQKGCVSVTLLKNIHQKNEYFTYSLWENEDDLNNYRNTALFKSVWKELKHNFSIKPEAWSLIQ